MTFKPYNTTTYMKTRKVQRKPMQGRNGVPSRPFACCLVALALPSLLWPLCQWDERVSDGVTRHGLYCWNLAGPRVVQTNHACTHEPRAVKYSPIRSPRVQVVQPGQRISWTPSQIGKFEAQPAASRPRRYAYELISYSTVSLFVCQLDVLIFARTK